MRWATVNLEGLDDQAAALWGLIERDTGDPRLRSVLAALYQRAQLPARNMPALGGAVQRLVQTHIKYLREQPETYASPTRTLKWRIGDCDDQAAVVCALLRSARVPCRLVFCGTDKGKGGAITAGHVYAEAQLEPGKWTALETVRAVPPGWNAPEAWRARRWRVQTWRYGDGASGGPRAGA